MTDDELTRLRAENEKLKAEVQRLRAELERLGRFLAPPAPRAESADEASEITWGYRRGDLDDDLGVD